MVLLITGAVVPGKNVPDTKLLDVESRKQQYTDAMKKCIEQISLVKAYVSGIVYVDNSNPDIQIFKECLELADSKNIKLEILGFNGNQERLEKQGKGYGEGEITKYAFINSELLKNDEFFLKLTGRLVIDNLPEIIRKIDASKCYFNMPNRTLPYMCDTRFYGMPVKLYRNKFVNAFLQVDDNAGHYLEHCLTDVVNGGRIKTMNFPRYPRYTGISGSKGHVYTYNKYKCLIKDFLSGFQYYRVKRK